MQIDANDVINKLTEEVSRTTQRAIIGEVRADAAEKRVSELEAQLEENNSNGS